MVGSCVSTNAIHITNLAQFTRRYGDNKKTKVLFGTAVELISTQNNPNTTQKKKIVVTDYDLGSGIIKWASINIRSVKAVDAEIIANVDINDVVPTNGIVIPNVAIDPPGIATTDEAVEVAGNPVEAHNTELNKE